MSSVAQSARAAKPFSFCKSRKRDAGKEELLSLHTGRRAKPSRSSLTGIRGIAVVAVLLSCIPRASATFPGQNGRIAYAMWSAEGTSNPLLSSNIFLTDLGQLTQSTSIVVGSSTEYSYDYGPAWSPDGNWVAFIRSVADVDTVEIIGKDGTGLRQVLSAAAIPAALPFVNDGPQYFHISSLAWSPDGQRLSFFVNHGTGLGSGIWTVNVDGSELTETVIGIRADGATTLLSPVINSSGYAADIRLSWSVNNQLIFACSFRVGSSAGLSLDLCLLDGATGAIKELPVNFADGTQTISRNWPALDWSPDGTTILFNADIAASNLFSQLFATNVNSNALAKQITNTGGGSCPPHAYSAAHYSPDGQWIVAVVDNYGPAAPLACTNTGQALAVFSAQGSTPSVITASASLVAGAVSSYDAGSAVLDWQPIPQALTVNFDDGHGDPLKGMKVELRDANDNILDGQPVNTIGGTYVFQNGASYLGPVIIRATLIDNTAPSGSQPAFDVRYADAATEPVWIETKAFLTGQPLLLSFSFSFAEPELSTAGPNLPEDGFTRLADMAAIAFRVHQYVDWIRARLTPSAVPTVSYYTFASADPDTMGPLVDRAYYNPASAKIVFNVAESLYANRDGTGNDEGPFVEWHEFTHHLHKNLINNRSSCFSPYFAHAGYPNPDTCDSMDEGFAEFLPTLASRDIIGPYLSLGDDGSLIVNKNSTYSYYWNLELPAYAWVQLGNYPNGNPIGGRRICSGWTVLGFGRTKRQYVTLGNHYP